MARLSPSKPPVKPRAEKRFRSHRAIIVGAAVVAWLVLMVWVQW